MTIDGATGASRPKFKMDMEQASTYIDELRQFPPKKRICICGHTVRVHNFDPTHGYSCSPGQIWCRCSHPVAVYCASDARFFMRSTHGVGAKHALGLGIATLTKRGGSGEWMVPLACAVKDCANMELTVACVNEDSKVVDVTTPNSVLICHDHARELGGWRL